MSVHRDPSCEKPLPPLPRTLRRRTVSLLSLSCCARPASAIIFADDVPPRKQRDTLPRLPPPSIYISSADSTLSFKTARQSDFFATPTRRRSNMTLRARLSMRSIRQFFQHKLLTTGYNGALLSPQAYAHIFDRICFFSDSRSLLAMRRVCRCLTPIADAQLLHHISLDHIGLGMCHAKPLHLPWQHALEGWIIRASTRVRILDLADLKQLRNVDQAILGRLVSRFSGNIVLRVLRDGEVPVAVPAMSVINFTYATPGTSPPIFVHPGKVFSPNASTMITHIRYEPSHVLPLGSLKSFGFGLRRTVIIISPMSRTYLSPSPSMRFRAEISHSRFLSKLPYGIVLALKLAPEGRVTLVGTETWEKSWFGAEESTVDIQAIIFRLVVERGLECGWTTESSASAMRRVEFPSCDAYRAQVGDEFFRLVMEE